MWLCQLAIRPLLRLVVAAMAAMSLAVSPVFAGQIAISDLIEHDPLGYECIPSSYLEETDDGVAAIAFSLTGKTRLPRTCLPNPCDRALSPRELSNITGTEVILARFSGEWDDYISRYADFCRAEVVFPKLRLDPVWANRTPVPGSPYTPPSDPVSQFWPPLIEQARIIQRTTPPSQRTGSPITVGLIDPPDWGIPNRPGDAPVVQVSGPRTIRMMTSAGGSGGYALPPDNPGAPAPPDTGTPAPSPVPLPPSGLLLLGAMALFARRKPTAAG